ncbi:hydrolase [Rossellomorea aquimaris]|uniref:hydrolase n=1 Tax=Rossellomorea aquimaris TaxID=189382 RepID=UPI001CD26D4E|nr:hydrolase [Rossellomorea aquimaris]MCA1054107.1 hydrolase [Rossellomorea aquimaris]
MGSRIMHSIIGYTIADRLSIEDKTSFLLGSIAADAVTPKDSSHFYQGDVQDYSRTIDYNGFLDKYSDHKDHPYVQGYFTHLIADDIWLKGFFLPWLKNRMEADNDLFHHYHRDFRLLNGKLLEYYGIADKLKSILTSRPEIIDLDEVKSEDVDAFIPNVVEDLAYDKNVIGEKLNVFTFDQIVGYIETSIDKGLMNVRSQHNV